VQGIVGYIEFRYNLEAHETGPGRDNTHLGEGQMHNMLLSGYVKFQNLSSSEDGQDLVEYALLLSLVALAMIASLNGLATTINKTFNNISTSLV
jgi:pilus assembly protein Flp/PilA